MQGAIQVCCFSLLFIIIVIIISSWSCGSVNHWLTLLGSYHSHSGQSSLVSCGRDSPSTLLDNLWKVISLATEAPSDSLTYRRYINNCIYLSIYLSESRSSSWLSFTEPCTAQLLDTCLDQLHRVADMPSRSRLRSASNRLDIRPSQLVTVGDRLFASAGPGVWNSLLEDVTSAPSLTVFRHKLKTHLFRHSYPDTVTAP